MSTRTRTEPRSSDPRDDSDPYLPSFDPKKRLLPRGAIFGDAVQIRIWHTTIMWLFLSFTALHVYLVVTEDKRMIRAMVDGYYYRKAGEVKQGREDSPVSLKRTVGVTHPPRASARQAIPAA